MKNSEKTREPVDEVDSEVVYAADFMREMGYDLSSTPRRLKQQKEVKRHQAIEIHKHGRQQARSAIPIERPMGIIKQALLADIAVASKGIGSDRQEEAEFTRLMRSTSLDMLPNTPALQQLALSGFS